MNNLQAGQLFQHKDGGIYRFAKYVRYSDRPNEIGVEYDHVWPFEQISWVRPLVEWSEDRFRSITAGEAATLMKMDKVVAQVEITNRKNERKYPANGG